MEYKHFSHEHNLKLCQVLPGHPQHRCSGCESFCSVDSSVYACWQCSFFLHEHCGNANRYVKHPSHTLHPLILVPRPTYSTASFICNACGATGTSFSYCCALCEVDLHVPCAFLPPQVYHPAHPHQLSLSHAIPTPQVSPHVCKICNQMLGSRHWTYYCLKCDFRVHTFCATKEVKPGLYQDDDNDVPVNSEPVTIPTMAEPPPGPEKNGCETNHEAQPPPEDPVVQLFKLQLEMEKANQLAQMMASFNLSSFV